jgi:hypothetical protein
MVQPDERRTFNVRLPVLPARAIDVELATDTTAEDVLARILERADAELGGDEWRGVASDVAWSGERTDEWALRVMREMEEGRWWSEEEIEGYRDRESGRLGSCMGSWTPRRLTYCSKLCVCSRTSREEVWKWTSPSSLPELLSFDSP